MDRSEPALVPQWLRNNGNSASGGGGVDHSLVNRTRSVSSANSGATTSDRTTAAYPHWNPGSRCSAHLQSYGSFGSRRSRNGVYEDPTKLYGKGKPTLGVSVNEDKNHSDHLGSRLQWKFQKDELLHSKSMNGWRDEDARLKNGSSKLSNDANNCHSSGNVLLGRGNGKINKPLFEQGFPSLVSGDNRVSPEIGRHSYPGSQQQLSSTADGWTSVMAEPPVTNGSGSSSILASPQVTSRVSALFPQSMVAANMADAVAQIPVRSGTLPELSVNTQRLEELAIKKSKQLIPMTPNFPRSHMMSSLDKSKSRMAQQQAKPSSSLSGSQSIRAGSLRLDAVKSSNPSKLQILNLSKDLNGVSPARKESLGSTNVDIVHTSTFSMAPPTGSSPAGSSLNHQIMAGLKRKPAEVSPNLEKKPSLQAQSRNEFFNCLKKKSSSNIFPACNGGHSLSSNLSEKSVSSSAMTITTEMKQEAPSSDRGIENDMVVISVNGGDDCVVARHHTVNGEDQLFPLNEEDAAFMRSLGWEESDGGDEGLTEEEINSFLKQLENMGQSLQPQKMAVQLKLG